jgi:penicillin-insensitive murein endopeptidase
MKAPDSIMSTRFIRFLLALLCLTAATPLAQAQSAQEQATLALLASPNLKNIPAKQLFGSVKGPANMPAQSIGSYAKGCLSGAQAFPINGPAWQVMRLSRNRNWANPALIKVVERLAFEAKQYDGWNGLMVGDMAQPRGGPMLTGHASHQIGLDADVWLNPMPDRVLSAKERENISAVSVVKDRKTIDTKVWTEAHARLIKRAASYPEVARIFVHPPIKAALCQWATGDRSWLAKVRPYYNHTYHFHIRIKCPPGSTDCKNQAPAAPKDGTGCGEELAYWMSEVPWRRIARDPNAPPIKPAPPLTLSGLPAECRAVVAAP